MPQSWYIAQEDPVLGGTEKPEWGQMKQTRGWRTPDPSNPVDRWGLEGHEADSLIRWKCFTVDCPAVGSIP
ncbi:uncharacterized protein N7469_005066 [Penicillium citrinum]|uniref:Uncharacterized protein n=2 Tax=Penicillium TaxID=5073 RepID=A0A9W9P0Z2_PENCI|nr:uncharacterized protein N7469_005066 [Penicillium citrinum]KAJ5233300.1 hypothetical protein N7469_005066 [Penicillium citrinum]KAJ5573234.1 hypothetical protein N7450_010218 [Penicillium hetheringtonii]